MIVVFVKCKTFETKYDVSLTHQKDTLFQGSGIKKYSTIFGGRSKTKRIKIWVIKVVMMKWMY